MSTLGAKHFLDKLEKLPGEVIVWEGGSSLRGVAVQLIYFVTVFALVLSIFFVAQGLPRLLVMENPSYVEPAKELDSAEDEEDAKNQVSKQAVVPQTILNFALIRILLWVSVFCVFGLAIAGMYLRVKNHWMVVTNERICIQSGTLSRQTVTIDIDKVVSVISSHSPLDRMFGVHAVEILHGGSQPLRVQKGLVFTNPYKINYVPVSVGLAGRLVNNWLPRDNRK